MRRCATLPDRWGYATAASRRAILPGFRIWDAAHTCSVAPPGASDAAGTNPHYRGCRPKPSTAAAGGPAPAGPRQRPADARAPTADASPLPARLPRKAPPATQPSSDAPTPSSSPASPSATRSRPSADPRRPQRTPPDASPLSSAATSPPPADAPDSAPSSAFASSAPHAVDVGLSPELLQQYQLSPAQHRQLEIYLDYLLEVNQSMNLTAVRDKSDAWQRHVVDSLALLPVIDRHIASSSGGGGSGGGSSSRSGEDSSVGGGGDSNEELRAMGSGEGASSSRGGRAQGRAAALRVVDVGTGAGLPGMVLAVARPQWKVTLLDSLRKRCDFLREAAARAGLSNVEVVWSRAEDGGRAPQLRQGYDLAVARAVAEARVLAELCLPFVRVGGLWVAAKGPDPEAEVAAAASAIRQLGGRQVALERVESHSAEGQRTALVVAKVAPTPAKFPRQAGTPNKKPL